MSTLPNKNINFNILIIISIFIFSSSAFSANEYYRSIATGNWNSPSTWQISLNSGGTWGASTSIPADTSGVVTIQSPNTVSIPASSAFTTNTLVINSGGILNINSASSLRIKLSLNHFGYYFRARVRSKLQDRRNLLYIIIPYLMLSLFWIQVMLIFTILMAE
jgi:hypothetical protein